MISTGHVYNQVKINGKWYYVDLTFDSEFIALDKELENCLKSEKTFKEIDEIHNNVKMQKIEESVEDYPKERVMEAYSKAINKYHHIQRTESILKKPIQTEGR